MIDPRFVVEQCDAEFAAGRASRDAEVAALRARIDAVREVYAGMEGFTPQTAPEAYLQQIIKQMYEAALGGEGK